MNNLYSTLTNDEAMSIIKTIEVTHVNGKTKGLILKLIMQTSMHLDDVLDITWLDIDYLGIPIIKSSAIKPKQTVFNKLTDDQEFGRSISDTLYNELLDNKKEWDDYKVFEDSPSKFHIQRSLTRALNQLKFDPKRDITLWSFRKMSM